MKTTARKIFIGIGILLIIIIVIIGIFYGIKTIKNKKLIDEVSKIYTNENIQEKIENNNDGNLLNLPIENNGKKVIGVSQIDKIDFNGLVYEGTDLDTLKIGVGHFSSSPFFDGNVCLAAHNTSSFWARLKDLEYDDSIKYISFLGTREYKVSNILQINETDFSLLENTDENIITLITCVKNNRPKRLCVQATEIN